MAGARQRPPARYAVRMPAKVGIKTCARAVAADIVACWLSTGAFPNRMLAALTCHRAFIMEMVYGIVRQRRLLDWVIARFTRRMPPPEARAFLYVGLYQLLLMENVAHYAAVHTTVQAVKDTGARRQADFINALLRRTAEAKTALQAELKRQPPGIRCSHPDELLARWTRRFGALQAEELCVWNNTRPDIAIHLNELRITPREFKRILADAGWGGRLRAGAAGAMILQQGLRVEDVPGYQEGLFWVIDPVITGIVALLDPQPGETVLDACAAPGGKTALIAERMRGCGRLVAMDLHTDRLDILRANMQRLGFERQVLVTQGDASRPSAELGLFDRILLDVPCSNTGVIRRKPDVRWRFSATRLRKLELCQRAILEQSAALLKPGGCMVYSTCSLESEENESLVRSWIRDFPDFCMRRELFSFPPDSAMDGAYAVLLVRKKHVCV